MKQTVVSGIQTSGDLHLGNYLGSISNWLKMQDEYECFFFLADLHSLTSSYSNLYDSTLKAAAIYLASGLDFKKVTIFQQSLVKEHTELAWLLNCVTPIGWLKRMTQFKDKAGKNQDNANTGIFTYPVLMAADILLYQADLVPVGADQKQHLELTRDIALLVNRQFASSVFKIPEPLIYGAATRVMSLRNGLKKMSKSDPSPASRINLIDNPDLIKEKIRKAKTDSNLIIDQKLENRPEISNLINIYAALSQNKVEQVINNYQNGQFSKFKNELAELIIARLTPIREEYNRLICEPEFLIKILREGASKAEIIASRTSLSVKKLFGFI